MITKDLKEKANNYLHEFTSSLKYDKQAEYEIDFIPFNETSYYLKVLFKTTDETKCDHTKLFLIKHNRKIIEGFKNFLNIEINSIVTSP